MNIEQEQIAFEDWALKDGLDLTKIAGGNYYKTETLLAWDVWLARAEMDKSNG